MRLPLLSLLMTLVTTNAVASEHTDTVATAKKRSVVTRILDYFNDANKEKKKQGIDFSVIGGPHYSTDTKLGIGLVASGLYHSARRDSLMPPSNVSVFGDFSTVGFYMIGIRGTHIFPGDHQRIDYTTYFYSFPSYFWGVGFDQGDNDANKSKLKRGQAQVKASWLFRASGSLFMSHVLIRLCQREPHRQTRTSQRATPYYHEHRSRPHSALRHPRQPDST